MPPKPSFLKHFQTTQQIITVCSFHLCMKISQNHLILNKLNNWTSGRVTGRLSLRHCQANARAFYYHLHQRSIKKAAKSVAFQFWNSDETAGWRLHALSCSETEYCSSGKLCETFEVTWSNLFSNWNWCFNKIVIMNEFFLVYKLFFHVFIIRTL